MKFSPLSFDAFTAAPCHGAAVAHEAGALGRLEVACAALRAQNQALKAENEALNAANGALRAEVEARASVRYSVGPGDERLFTLRESPSASQAACEGASSLTQREREVLRLVADGRSSKEICADLAIALPTVESHRRNISMKLGVRTIAGLTKIALLEGLITLKD